jgi:hypothetical protein
VKTAEERLSEDRIVAGDAADLVYAVKHPRSSPNTLNVKEIWAPARPQRI